MKSWCVCLVSIGLGLGLGYGLTWAEFRPRPVEAVAPVPVAAPGVGQPRMMIDGSIHDFGRVEQGVPQKHTFLVRNGGKAPLVLTLKSTSCHCALADLGEDQDTLAIPPGGEAPVTLSLDGSLPGGPFDKHALLTTNDPTFDELRLVLSGEVVWTVMMVPANLAFTSLSTTEATTASARMFCFHKDPLEIKGHHLEQSEGADHVQVGFRPLTSEELADQKAHSGYEVQVTILPGLPLGPIKHQIVVDTNLVAVQQVVIPVDGRVTGDISVYGHQWDEATGVACLGVVRSVQGAEFQFKLAARGEHRESTRFSVEKFDPPWLEVELDQPEGLSVVTLLIVRIPRGSPPINRASGSSGYGQVLLRTTHPSLPQVRIDLDFAVER